MPYLNQDHKTWEGWLNSQWQTYWSAVPIGDDADNLKTAALDLNRSQELEEWLQTLYELYRVAQPEPSQQSKGQPEKKQTRTVSSLTPIHARRAELLTGSVSASTGHPG